MKAVVINLDRDKERLAHVESEAKRAGLMLERVAALTPDSIPEKMRATYFATVDGLKPGEVACYASHLHVAQQVAQGTYGNACLVLEDDIVFCDGFAELLDEAVKQAPMGWDIIRLSNPPKAAVLKVAELQGGRRFLVKYSLMPMNTGAYVLSQAGAAKLLNEQVPRCQPIDIDLRFGWRYGLESFGVYPPLVLSNIFDSSINQTGKRVEQNWLQKTIPQLDMRKRVLNLAHNIRSLGFGKWLACKGGDLHLALSKKEIGIERVGNGPHAIQWRKVPLVE